MEGLFNIWIKSWLNVASLLSRVLIVVEGHEQHRQKKEPSAWGRVDARPLSHDTFRGIVDRHIVVNYVWTIDAGNTLLCGLNIQRHPVVQSKHLYQNFRVILEITREEMYYIICTVMLSTCFQPHACVWPVTKDVLLQSKQYQKTAKNCFEVIYSWSSHNYQ